MSEITAQKPRGLHPSSRLCPTIEQGGRLEEHIKEILRDEERSEAA
jgi:hypothetical protein